ncbi:MAG TPA: methyltransferase [Allosphingosinicella sp.]|nr:methyltransferase [Allosphingosinicella sp.]
MAAAAALCLAAGLPHAAGGLSLRQALADPGRAAQRSVDARRHPAELVALADVRPGQRILDLIPGDGYWSRIFSKMVGPAGRVYAIWPEAYGKLALGNVQQLRAMSASPAYRNVVTMVEPSVRLSAPEPLDVVWTSQNYHDYNDRFMGNPGPAALAADAFRLLKPGGLFIIIDHATAPGRGMSDTESLHRIDRAIVVKQVTAAGFRLAGESNVLRNPADPHTIAVFDKTIRVHTDQFALKFRKPESSGRKR